MNQYGAMAQRHWERWLPSRYREIKEPESYFAQLGEEIETRIEELSQGLAGEDPPGETYLEKLGRLNMARLAAEEQALTEMALLEPEETEETENAQPRD